MLKLVLRSHSADWRSSMRLLANHLGPAETASLSDPSSTRNNVGFLDRFEFRPGVRRKSYSPRELRLSVNDYATMKAVLCGSAPTAQVKERE
jgi:hypothetical protein